MNAHVLLLAALVAVAAARPQEYHDDVFHFSTKVNPENFVRSSLAQPNYQQQQVVVKNVPVYSQVRQVHEVHHVQHQPSVLFRSVEQEIPAISSLHTHHVHQPAFSQVSTSHVSHQVVPATTSVVSSRSFSAPQFARQQYSGNQYSAGQYSAGQYSAGQYSAAEPKIKILRQVQEFDPVGIYKSNYETENGISSDEQGTVKDIQAKEGPVAAKQGSYSYTGPDGVVYSVNWIADEFGYRAAGAHLPVAPEIPAEIKESLRLIASQPQQQYDDNGNLLRSQF